MAKPKGGTLSALFEVSEQERQAFYDRIQQRIHPVEDTPIEKGIPDSGTPLTSTPLTGTPFSGTPISSGLEVPVVTATAKHLNLIESGTPEKGIPDSGTPYLGIPVKGISSFRSLRIRRAFQVQDGHSLGEQLILTTLWNQAVAVEGQTYRRIAIGYRTLSGECGLTVNNCKANLKSLQAKLALEPETTYSTTSATTYRVYSFAEILRRRETAGLTHVLRSRGSVFVHPETGIPVSGTPPIPVPGIPDYEKGIPDSGEKGVPETGTLLRRKKERDRKEGPSSSVDVVSATIRKHLAVDDDAVRLIIEGCQRNDPECTLEEIAEFAAMSASKISKQRNVDNPAGLLINQAPRFFPGAELTAYRARKAKELSEARETARRVLDDPESPAEAREWAKTVISDER